MMEEAKKPDVAEQPMLQRVAEGWSKILYATNSAYLKSYSEDLATAVEQQSSYSEVFVVEYKDTDNFKLQMHISDLMNGLLMHSKISKELGTNQVLEKAMKVLPCKGVFLFEATEKYTKDFPLVKIGTPLVNNIKSGYVPSILLKTDVFSEGEPKDYVTIDRDTAMALQILDVHSLEMTLEFGQEFGKMLKPLFKHCGMNLVAGEYTLGIDSTNNMRLMDFRLLVLDGNNEKMSYKDIVTKLGL